MDFGLLELTLRLASDEISVSTLRFFASKIILEFISRKFHKSTSLSVATHYTYTRVLMLLLP